MKHISFVLLLSSWVIIFLITPLENSYELLGFLIAFSYLSWNIYAYLYHKNMYSLMNMNLNFSADGDKSARGFLFLVCVCALVLVLLTQLSKD